MLRGSTLRQIGDTVAELLGKPCVIYNAQFRQLALSPATTPVESCPTLLGAKVRAVPSVTRLLAELRPGVPEIVEPVPQAGSPHRILVSSVMLGTHLLGYIALAEHGATLLSSTSMTTPSRKSRQRACAPPPTSTSAT